MIESIIQMMRDHAGLLWMLTIFSVITVILFITLGARIVARMPADYFINRERPAVPEFHERYPGFVRGTIRVLKNLLGSVLLVVGFLLLFVPGQGLLTMLAGVLLMNFPGKFKCELWLVRRPQVYRSINWLRRRADQPPLVLE